MVPWWPGLLIILTCHGQYNVTRRISVTSRALLLGLVALFLVFLPFCLDERFIFLKRMPIEKHRSTHARAILGPELYAQLANTNVLLVGAGGIGCELRKWSEVLEDFFLMSRLLSVKTVAMTGFGKITLLDLDTIDLSNLNRQFLFKKKDVKQSKALVRLYSY